MITYLIAGTGVHLRATFSFAFIAIIAACVHPLTGVAGDLSVTTTVTPAQFRAGDRVSVLVVVTNTGLRTHTISGKTCPQVFAVESPDGTVVGPSAPVCTMEAVNMTLSPGATYSWTQSWTGDGVGVFGKPTVLLPPGIYSVRGAMIPSGSRNPGATVNITP
jgi:hypothetical protein